jgi:formyltetrahydrofolate-dependent phosphoribosylglycinamide formyltransferase
VPTPRRVAVLASGTGSLFEALVEEGAGTGAAPVVGLVCDRPGAAVLARAERLGVPAVLVPLSRGADRTRWDAELTAALQSFQPDLVVSAGFMRLLGPRVLGAFPDRVVNSHPALLPAFPGAHAVRDTIAYGAHVTGCTVHLVDSGVDTGPVLAQQAVPVQPDDDEDDLHERIKAVERVLLPATVGDMLARGWSVAGRKVTIG